tara:strand:+ start:12 stop:182 length:171 start_codon:yes stop_codon:yes gene_type:complete
MKFEVTVEHSYYTTYLVEADSAEEAAKDWEFGEAQGDPVLGISPALVVNVIEESEV